MSRTSIRRHATATAAAVVLPVAAFALATLAAEIPAAASPSGKPAPAAEYTATIKATHGHGVHFVSTATESGTTIHVVGDAGATSGTQTITVKRGSVDEHVQVVRVGPTGYVDANDAALRNVIGLTSAQSSKYAGRWLSFPTSNTALDALIGGLLNSDVASELQMRGPYFYVPSTTIGGQATIGIRGRCRAERPGSPPDPLRDRDRCGPAGEGGDEPRPTEGFVGHPRRLGVLGLGREEDGDGPRARGLAAQGGRWVDVRQIDAKHQELTPYARTHGPVRSKGNPVRSNS